MIRPTTKSSACTPAKKSPPAATRSASNGRFFILRGDKWYKVPAWLLSSIDNCITERPQRDEFDRFIGTRPMKRFPYETFRG